MNILKTIEEIHPLITEGSCITLGNFDGVHIGHQKLLSRVKEKARDKVLTSVVVTFDPHPLRVIKGSTPAFITPTEQKLELLSKLGLDYVLCLTFDKQMAELSAEDFVYRYLVQGLLAKELVIGHDYTFGKDRKGNFQLLVQLGEKYGFNVEQVQAVSLNGQVVSSTNIRNLIQEGSVQQAKPMLGRFFQITGTVAKGKKRGGPLLGIPTANLQPVDELIPKPGVYAVWAQIGENIYPGVANVGYNPTFADQSLSVEVHIFDFQQDIYHQKLRVHFVQRIRDEKKFSNIDALLEQIHTDIQQARKLLDNPENILEAGKMKIT